MVQTRLFIITLIFSLLSASNISSKSKIEFENNPEENNAEVYDVGSFYTSFIYIHEMGKHVLYPNLATSGKIQYFEVSLIRPEKFPAINGNVTELFKMNNDAVNGVYRNANSIKGVGKCCKKSRWVALGAKKEGENITIVITDDILHLSTKLSRR